VLVVNPSFAAHSVADVITMARTDPGKINFGTGGLGTTPHMTAELFEHDAASSSCMRPIAAKPGPSTIF
jgi:tripartite-type tricarboxylate transporter receptor subunit TctC